MFFSHARTALKFALKNLNLAEDAEIFVPDYNCQAIYQPLDELKISYQYYSLDERFEPNWLEIIKNIKKNTKAILMVHYFGQPQNIKKFTKFCKEYNLYLIEDNSHGFSGLYNGQTLGTFGDIGFSSPRKILNLNSGGILYTKKKELLLNDVRKERYPRNIPRELFFNFFRKNPRKRELVKKYIRKKPNFGNPLFIKEYSLDNYYFPDLGAERTINDSDWNKIARKRRNIWEQWTRFAKENNFRVIFEKPKEETCPWIVPFYVEDLKTRNELLNKSWNEGLGFMSWPTLPERVIQKNEKALKRWEKLICINLDHTPL